MLKERSSFFAAIGKSSSMQSYEVLYVSCSMLRGIETHGYDVFDREAYVLELEG
jgi:hypothetical protein